MLTFTRYIRVREPHRLWIGFYSKLLNTGIGCWKRSEEPGLRKNKRPEICSFLSNSAHALSESSGKDFPLAADQTQRNALPTRNTIRMGVTHMALLKLQCILLRSSVQQFQWSSIEDLWFYHYWRCVFFVYTLLTLNLRNNKCRRDCWKRSCKQAHGKWGLVCACPWSRWNVCPFT